VALVTNALGLGGTEKMLQSCALGARAICDVHVVGVQALGERAEMLASAGIPVACADSDPGKLAELLRGTDVVHVFRHGAADAMVPNACRTAGVEHLIESNIFGHVDRSTDEVLFDCHLFVSKFCLLRYRERLGGRRAPDFHRRHRVLSAPIEFEPLRAAAPAPREARELLGLDPDRPVVGRVGRAADLKWRRLVIDMAPRLLALVPDVQLAFVGLTDTLRARARELGVLDRITELEPTGDPARLAAYYASCDVFASAAEIGESQGIAIGEALALEVPVVTCSTPWVDNAQVEFVEHGRSGWYASHPNSFAEAVADLLGDEQRRRAFGRAGAQGMERLLHPGDLPERVQALYASVAAGGEAPEAWTPSPEEVEAFAADYERRARLEFRPLSARERAEVRTERARERIVRTREALPLPGGRR
jgi:glycosyltransferase involved in cell wall biosynthesis